MREEAKRNIALRVAYDGSAFSGWQRQAFDPTIQGSLESALTKICKHPVTLYGCSRTDAGVHAQAHVSNFFTDCRIPCEKLPLALDAYLPPSIRCLEASEVPLDFNARFKAIAKQYSYYILNTRRADPRFSRYSYHEGRPLDLEAMSKAAAWLVGEHDFSAFQAMGSPSVGGNQRRLYSLRIMQLQSEPFIEMSAVTDYRPYNSPWDPTEEMCRSAVDIWPLTGSSDGLGLLRIVVHGSGFLYNMMRIIAGTLLYVGLGKMAPDQILDALASGNRNLTGKTLDAKGLCLDRVDYRQAIFGLKGEHTW